MVEMKRLGVIGNPIKHSLSPEIHTIFAREHGIDISYTKIESTIDSFNKDVEEFFQNDGIGLNITLPFKEMAYNLSDEPDDVQYYACRQDVSTGNPDYPFHKYPNSNTE